jgi:hypothetical protein
VFSEGERERGREGEGEGEGGGGERESFLTHAAENKKGKKQRDI